MPIDTAMEFLTPVAFAAILQDAESVSAASIECHRCSESLKSHGIANLRFFTQKLEGVEVVLAMMDVADGKNPAQLWRDAGRTFPDIFSKLNQGLRAHPRHAGTSEELWVLTETVCELRLPNAKPVTESSTWHAAVTGLKKEKEAEYRLLHNAVWPGVKHAIGASNISRFDVFLIEFGDNQPYLFFLLQFTGDDFATDMLAQANSPVNQRWWKFTDACQQPLPGAEGSPWLALREL